MRFLQKPYDLNTEIIKLKETIARYKMYEEKEEFKILIIRLRTVMEKLENLLINQTKITTQVNQLKIGVFN